MRDNFATADESAPNRRDVLGRAIIAAGAMAAAPSLAGALRPRQPIALPNAAQVRADIRKMVDFGPRLPGTANHLRFVKWLAAEFRDAGLVLGPCENYAYRRWEPRRAALAVGGVDVPRVSYYVRSHPTGPDGVSGPLVYGGTIEANGTSGLGDFARDAILVFDGRLPTPSIGELTDPEFPRIGNDAQEGVRAERYHRVWMTPPFNLDTYLARGAAGVIIIIMDVSSAIIAGNFSPHASRYQPPLPALFVGNDVGAALREQAKAGRAQGKLTLDAEWIDGTVPMITAILPGASDEVMVVNTHTDGQNFIEENGCIALLHLARHFASRPAGKRLKRSIVFAAWPGHMSGVLPECAGWIRAHPDIVKRAAASFTIEHLGATEWVDRPGSGYGPTGRNEYMNCPVTAGPLRDMMTAGVVRHALLRHGIQKGPGITVGSAFHRSGVPHAACICGPNYLLGITANGHIDKLDADLAVRQTALFAELIEQADKVPADRLRASDPTLGSDPVIGADTSVDGPCL